MDPPKEIQEEKKLVEIRQQITPQGDEVDEQVHSNNQSDDLKEEGASSEAKSDVCQQDEKWQNLPNREFGESQSLQPIVEEQQKQALPSEGGDETKKNGESGKQRKNYKKQSQRQREQYKLYSLPVDSKYIFACFYLLRNQFRQALKPYGGYVRFNPYINCKQIKIFYKDEAKLNQMIDKLEEFINSLQLIDMGKVQAECGVQMSYKYMQQLKKQKITIFKDLTQNFKTMSYYMCGMVLSKKSLLQKVSEIKKMNFIWFHLYNYENTRSYRAILRKIFSTPLTHQFIKESVKCNEIEVANIKRDYLLNNGNNKYGNSKIMILLTSLMSKKVAIHQQIDKQVSNFIKQRYLVFTFAFIRSRQSYAHRYTPKIQNVQMFFILQKLPVLKTGYLYIIVETNSFKRLRETIINQIKNMKLEINGQRFFKNLFPQRPYLEQGSNYKLLPYPRCNTYSWTLKMRTKGEFDWASLLKS